MPPSLAYCTGKLVRVVCDGPRPFVAGVIIDRDSRRAIVTAPILGYLRGQHEDKLRQTFRRLGWRATVVRDFLVDDQVNQPGVDAR